MPAPRSISPNRNATASRTELARAQQQVEALRTNERELRSHFVEITSLIEERDEALEEVERRGHAIAEATKKNETIVRERNDAQRQREDAVRQRDEMGRKFEAFSRSTEEQARLVSETQKQLLTIRQARDGAHAQILDLNTRLGRAEDQIAELEYQRDAAQKASKQSATEATDFRRQLDVVTTDRDATAKQVEQLSEDLDAQRKKYLDLVEQKSAALQADSEHTVALDRSDGPRSPASPRSATPRAGSRAGAGRANSRSCAPSSRPSATSRRRPPRRRWMKPTRKWPRSRRCPANRATKPTICASASKR